MVNSPLIRPYLLGGSFGGGGTFDCHDVFPCVSHNLPRSKGIALPLSGASATVYCSPSFLVTG